MKFRGNLHDIAVSNTYYRKVIDTTKEMQLVVMSLQPLEEIGMEVHEHNSQLIKVEAGHATAYIGNNRYFLKKGGAIIVPAGTRHNIVNSDSKEDLKLYTVYSPPNHRPGLKQARKSS